MKKNREIEKKLKQEVKVPEQVQSRVEDTLRAITQEKHISLQEKNEKQHTHWYQRKLGVVAASLALGVLVIGTTAGAYSVWEKQFEKARYGIEEETRDTLKSNKILNEDNWKVTDHGVTVECVETIAAGRYAYLMLKVSVPKDVTIDEHTFFESYSFLENDEFVPEFSINRACNPETEKSMVDAEQGIFYVDVALETSDMVYDKNTDNISEKENKNKNWDGQTLSLSLKNLKQSDNLESEEKTLVKGEWNLEIPMKASTKERVFEVNKVYNQDTTIHTITLTPISMSTYFSKPDKENRSASFSVDSMVPIEYELDDGTRKRIEIERNASGCLNEETGERGFEISTQKIMDVDRIAAIYFAGKRVELKNERDGE